MKAAVKLFILISATWFIVYVVVGVGSWYAGVSDVVVAFALLLAALVGYVAFKLLRLSVLSESEPELKGSGAILVLRILFCIVTLYLLVRYGALVAFMNGMMSFGSYSPMTAEEFFMIIAPVALLVLYVVTLWWPTPFIVWPLYFVSVLVTAYLVSHSFGSRGVAHIALVMTVYMVSWAFLSARRAKETPWKDRRKSTLRTIN